MKKTYTLTDVAKVLLVVVLFAVILVFAKAFLVPLTLAAVLAMALLPVVKWLQGKGVSKVLAIVLAVLIIVLLVALVVFLVGWQAADLASKAAGIEQKISSQWQELQKMISDTFGISASEQQKVIKEQQSSSGGKMSGAITGILAGISGVLGNFLLVLVYIFLLIFFRDRLKGFILQIVPLQERPDAADTLGNIQKVSQKYLGGMAVMIMMLWVMYGIGFSIVGVENALFFAVLCGILEIVPFVGNLIGTSLTIIVTLAQGGDSQVVLWILVVYAVVQFVQTYLLEPLIVGAGVSINPLFTIVGLIAGEMLWGIPGMILAIPLLGIFKVVCENIDGLKPYAYLIGTSDDDESPKDKAKNAWKKIKGWFGK